MRAVNILAVLGGYFALLLAAYVLLQVSIPQFAGMAVVIASLLVVLLLTEIAIRGALITTGIQHPAFLGVGRKIAVGLVNLLSVLVVALSTLVAWGQTRSEGMVIIVIVAGATLLVALNAAYGFSRAKPSQT